MIRRAHAETSFPRFGKSLGGGNFDCYWIAFYPKKYQDSPQALRERIRKNEAVINDREF